MRYYTHNDGLFKAYRISDNGWCGSFTKITDLIETFPGTVGVIELFDTDVRYKKASQQAVEGIASLLEKFFYERNTPMTFFVVLNRMNQAIEIINTDKNSPLFINLFSCNYQPRDYEFRSRVFDSTEKGPYGSKRVS